MASASRDEAMTDSTNIKYEILKVADVIAHAEGDIGVIILDTDQGRIGLHLRRNILVLLGDEIAQALSREA
ncbi:MAG: hypothetical protein IID53_12110 [Proteobacteria bacterium]|nr:hypothetical protein [Pseudomonadota bacterium]